MPRLELGRYFYHRILSPTRLRFRHTGLILRVGLEPTSPFGQKFLKLPCIPFHHLRLSSKWDSNPHVLSDTRLSFSRGYQITPSDVMLSVRGDSHSQSLSSTDLSSPHVYIPSRTVISTWRDLNPHAGSPTTDLKSVVSAFHHKPFLAPR